MRIGSLFRAGEITERKKQLLQLEAMCSPLASLIETNEANNWNCGQFTARLYLEAFHIPKQTTVFTQFDFNRYRNQCNRQDATTLLLMINTMTSEGPAP